MADFGPSLDLSPFAEWIVEQPGGQFTVNERACQEVMIPSVYLAI